MAEKSEGGSDVAEQFAESTSTIHKILECPICLDVAKKPVKTCTRGHITCSSCVDESTSKLCSLCESTFLEHSPTCLNNLLEALPYFCRYKDAGCKATIAVGNTHELFCGFRVLSCRGIGCGKKIMVREAEDHYEQEHYQGIKRDAAGKVYWPKRQFEKETQSYDPVMWGGNFGYVWFDNRTLDSDKLDKNLKVTYKVFPIGKANTDVFLRIEFNKGKFVFAKTIKPTIMKGEVDTENCDTGVNIEEYCLKLPQIYFNKFLDKDQDLEIHYEYFEQD